MLRGEAESDEVKGGRGIGETTSCNETRVGVTKEGGFTLSSNPFSRLQEHSCPLTRNEPTTVWDSTWDLRVYLV